MKFFPIMGDSFTYGDYAPLNLSIHSSTYYDVDAINVPSLSKYLSDIKSQSNAKFLYGGYLEQRAIYTSDHFTKDTRDIHLGVDVWASEGTKIFAPCDMVLHSMAYNGADLDYGYTLIYYIEYLDSYLLLGHLSENSINDKKVGMKVKAKTPIAEVGNISENGGWESHIHVQLINDIGDWQGDYPGVCKKSEMKSYRQNCPDPTFLILIN